MSSVCACIPTYRRPETVRLLLENLAAQSRLPDEILVVDSSPDDQTQQIVTAWNETPGRAIPVQWIASPKGLTRQRVVGIQRASSDLILMLDDDISLEPDCLAVMAAFLESGEGRPYGGISAYIVNEYGKSYTRIQRLFHRLGIYEDLTPGRWLYCHEFMQLSLLQPFTGIHRSQFIPGGCTLYRRSVLTAIGPDPAFDFGGEDKHLSLRISQHYPLGVLGQAHVRHTHAQAGRKSRFRRGIIYTRKRAVILVDCDPDPTRRRYRVYLAYHGLILMIETFLLLPNFRRWDQLPRVAGSWVGWVWNLVWPPRRKPA